jgi:hypothetical protein
MKKYKFSNHSTEKEIFACMITSLIDEARFYHLYPDK